VGAGEGEGEGESEGRESEAEGEGRESEGGGSDNIERLRDELLENLNYISTYQFKLPLLCKTFFKVGIDNEKFYQQKIYLALLYSVGKENFSKKYKSINLFPEDIKKILEELPEYLKYYNFILNNLDDKFYVDKYKILTISSIPQKILKDLPFDYVSGTSGSSGIIASTSGIRIVEAFTLEDIKDLLQGDTTMLYPYIMDIYLIIKSILHYIEKDNYYYRIISLVSIINPEFYDKNFFEAHANILMTAMNMRTFSFINFQNIYDNSNITDEIIINTMVTNRTNLDVINMFPDGDKFIYYVGKNVQQINTEVTSIKRKNHNELTEEEINIIVKNIIYFYLKSYQLSNYLKSIEKFNTLQVKSMSSYLVDIRIITGIL
jgi:hypothetical protein